LNLSVKNKDLLEVTAEQSALHRPASFKVLALVGQSIGNRSTAQARMALVRFKRRTAPCSQKTGTQRMVAMDNLGSKRDYTILPPGCGGLQRLGSMIRRMPFDDLRSPCLPPSNTKSSVEPKN